MRRMLAIARQHAICLTVLCLVIGFASSAFAVPPEETLVPARPDHLRRSMLCFFQPNHFGN